MNSASSSPDAMPDPMPGEGPRRFSRRWIVFAVVAVFLVLVMREVLDPYDGADYTEVPHGNHSHFVPKDRDPDVEIGRFPSTRPGPGQRITPQGQIVPK